MALGGPARARGADGALDVAEIAARIPERVADREGWARDLADAFRAIRRPPDAASVCTALAVTELATRFEADRRLDQQAPWAFRALLRREVGSWRAGLLELVLSAPVAGGGPDFLSRFEGARTEGDVDRIYRDLVRAWGSRSPLLLGLVDEVGRVVFGAGVGDLDPVATLGPMQVSVRWAAGVMGSSVADASLRSMLASRRGGLLFGVARLFGWEQRYDGLRFLVADYNAGPFSSRNAEFQRELAQLTGRSLPLDGDLLSYRRDGSVRRGSRTLDALRLFVSESGAGWGPEQPQRDLALEKGIEFERTMSWRAVRAAWEAKRGRPAPYARIPAVPVSSKHTPAMASVEGYVERVQEWARACRESPPAGEASVAAGGSR